MNNIIEQDHRRIKQKWSHPWGFIQ